MRTLTPDDIKRENAFRTAQRKAGRSRKSNLKDPNAPKKPLSAYFMFLQRIRSDPLLVREIFGDEQETTKQSVLAAAKWRSMTDDERKVGCQRAAFIVLVTNATHYSHSWLKLNKRSLSMKLRDDSTRKERLELETASISVSFPGRRLKVRSGLCVPPSNPSPSARRARATVSPLMTV